MKILRIFNSFISAIFVKSAMAAAVMFPAASVAAQWIGNQVDLGLASGRLLQVAGGVFIGAAVYGAAAFWLKMDEVALVTHMFRRMARRDR